SPRSWPVTPRGAPAAAPGGGRALRSWLARPRRAEAVVCACFAAVALLTVALFALPSVIWYSHPPGSPMASRVAIVGIVVAVLGTAALWWRRRFPVTVAAGFVVLALVSRSEERRVGKACSARWRTSQSD